MSSPSPTAEAMIQALDTTRCWLGERLIDISEDTRLLKLLATVAERSPTVLSTAIRKRNWKLHELNGSWGVVFTTKNHWVNFPFVSIRDLMESGALEQRAKSAVSWASKQQLRHDVDRLRSFTISSEKWSQIPNRRKKAAEAELARQAEETQ